MAVVSNPLGGLFKVPDLGDTGFSGINNRRKLYYQSDDDRTHSLLTPKPHLETAQTVQTSLSAGVQGHKVMGFIIACPPPNPFSPST